MMLPKHVTSPGLFNFYRFQFNLDVDHSGLIGDGSIFSQLRIQLLPS